MSVGFLYTSVFSVLTHLVITVPRKGMEPSCSSSMAKDKLGWTLLSTSVEEVCGGFCIGHFDQSVINISSIKRRDHGVAMG